jgi:alpha-maltose-1-phosphate synthase
MPASLTSASAIAPSNALAPAPQANAPAPAPAAASVRASASASAAALARDSVCVSSLGQFHMFELAQQLQQRRLLRRLYTATPRFLVRSLPKQRVRAFPWVYAPAKLLHRYGAPNLGARLNFRAATTFDNWVARSLALEPCRIFHFLSSFGVRSHADARRRFGAVTICDRGSSHIAYQDDILREEFARWGRPYEPIDPRVVERELAEYASADYILVPSSFSERSFIERGIPRSKLRRAAYGADLSLFHGAPKLHDKFRVIYVGALTLRKGIPYLLEAVSRLQPHVELDLVGPASEEIRPFLAKYEGSFRYLGAKPKSELREHYSNASVFVLASIEEGLALVMAQAMACGLPVIATENTGAADLFDHGVEGFIVPIRSAKAIQERLEFLLANPQQLHKMSAAALKRVQSLGGWDSYGDAVEKLYVEALEEKQFVA